MAIPNYTPGYPPDGSSLGQTKAVIRDNLDGTFQVFTVDHQNQNETGPGSHAQAQLKNIPGGPWTSFAIPIPTNLYGTGYETLYSANANGNGELAFVRGPTNPYGIQLTGPGTPNLTGSNANSFVAGGFVINFGIATNGANTFNKPYPRTCLAVVGNGFTASGINQDGFFASGLTGGGYISIGY